MRPLVLAACLALAATPALAYCPPPLAVGSVPEQISDQTAALICQQNELREYSSAQSRQLELDAQLRQQQIMLEQQLKLQQQLNAQIP